MSDESPIIFTDSCCTKVADLIAEENNPDLKLRVFVNGGGCSGFQYGFTFDENQKRRHFEIQKNGLTFLVDPMSYQYLVGAEIDYTESLQGSQFVIRNPNAETTCGCGLVLLRINNPFLHKKTGRLYLQTAFCVNLF